MDDSTHGDKLGPAETEDERPSKAEADKSLRPSIANVIPTVASHPARFPSQTPPWPEEEVTSGPGGDDLAEGQAAAEPLVTIARSTELSSSMPLGTEVAAEPDHHALAETDAAAEALVAPPASEIAPPEPPDAAGSDTFRSAPPAETTDDQDSDQEADEGSDLPASAERDVEQPLPSRIEDGLEQPFLSVSDLSETSEPQPVDEIVGAADQPGVLEVPRPDEQHAPIEEEQIWFGPPAADSTAAVPSDSLGRAPVENGGNVEPASSTGEHAAEALINTAQVSSPTTVPPSTVLTSSDASPSAFWSPTLPAPAGGARLGSSRLRLALRIGAAVVVMPIAIVLFLVILYRWVDPPASTLMLGQRLTGTEIEQRWVPIDRISTNLVQAVILSEDGAFCRHKGVDWSALEEAIESSRGGSTITMQVVKNLFLWPQRSYIRKALEIMLAYVVEAVWSKERILEIYLNIAEWGPGVFGAEAASRHHFGKAASRLSAQEAALLAVSLPSPLERQAGYPGWQTRRLADNLLLRMRAVRTVHRCVRPGRG